MEISIQPIISTVKKVFETYAWLKVLVPLFMGAVVGSGLITFINRYAIYNYAVAYGGRLPAESVPYIDVSISILSFAFLIVSLFTAVLVYGILTYTAEILHKYLKKAPEVIVQLIAGVATSVIGAGGTEIISGVAKDRSIDFSIDWVQFSYLIVAGIALALLIYFKSYIKYLAPIATLLLIIFVSSRLFNAENYASFLRQIQYGGGVEITAITVKDKEEIHGHLFLTTREAYVIWNSSLTQFEEIPIKEVKQINYHEGRQFSLPVISGSILRLFEHLWRI